MYMKSRLTGNIIAVSKAAYLLWQPFPPVKVVPGDHFSTQRLQNRQRPPCCGTQPYLILNLHNHTLCSVLSAVTTAKGRHVEVHSRTCSESAQANTLFWYNCCHNSQRTSSSSNQPYLVWDICLEICMIRHLVLNPSAATTKGRHLKVDSCT